MPDTFEEFTISDNIKKIRQEKGLTQAELAAKCQMKDTQLRRYELGQTIPREKQLERIADALEVDVSELKARYVFKIDDVDLNDFLQEHINYYKNIIFEWIDSRGYEYVETSDAIQISKNGKCINFTEEDIDFLQDFIDNYLDVQLERKIKELESSDSE